MAQPLYIRNLSAYQLSVHFDDGSWREAFQTSSGIWLLQQTEDGIDPAPDPDPDPEPEPPITPGAGFQWPFPPEDITVPWEGYPGHKGVDITKPRGLPIIAAQSGHVQRTYAGQEGVPSSGNGWGNYIRIDHGQVDGTRIMTGYAHLEAFPLFNMGATVNKGDVIGYVGNTGRSQGPHLHFEVYRGGTGLYDGVRIDPLPWMNAHQ